jgi:hypothetical protein
MTTKNMNLNFGATSAKTPGGENRKSTSTFKPTVTSTKDMNLNLSAKTPANQNKAAVVKTPAASARKSVGARNASARKSVGGRKSLASE